MQTSNLKTKSYIGLVLGIVANIGTVSLCLLGTVLFLSKAILEDFPIKLY